MADDNIIQFPTNRIVERSTAGPRKKQDDKAAKKIRDIQTKQFVETAVDISGFSNYTVISTTQLMSVPYALYAKNAGSSPADNDWTESGSNIYRNSGNVGIGNNSPSAKLDVAGDAIFKSTGSIQIPVGDTSERPGIAVTGQIRYNTQNSSFEGYDGSAWGSIGGGATGGGSDQVFIENERVVTTNYTLSTNKSALCVGPLTINTGVTVTIPSGERLVIL